LIKNKYFIDENILQEKNEAIKKQGTKNG
jgi:hypothetical protein